MKDFDNYNEIVGKIEDCITDIFAILEVDYLQFDTDSDFQKFMELSYRLALLVLQFK